jgi:amino acid adenylation domain-containing protein
VSHGNVAAFAAAVGQRFKLDTTCRSIAFASLAFDVSVLDILVPLCYGGSVQLIPDEDRIDPIRLQRFLERHRVTWGVLPPAVLPLLNPARLPDLADLITAGEPPGPEQVARWTGDGAGAQSRRFHNWYGPTETTVCVTGIELSGTWDRPLPIGPPLPGCTAHVLDERLEPCPVEVAGELCIGGPQLARGYLGQPGQTTDRSIPDPFSSEPGARLYRTGDQAVWKGDGSLAFLGRLDRQLKIHGQRVEIGEIEAVLLSNQHVQQAVVNAEPGPGGQPQLVAYLVPVAEGRLGEIQDYCAERLPGYMVPARIFSTPLLPLNVSGKVDLAALRAQAARHPRTDGPAKPAGPMPDTEVFGAVAALWAQMLGPGSPGPDDEFIASGGDSLLAMRLVSALSAETGRQVTVEHVFAGRTAAGISERVAAAPRIGPDNVTAAAPELAPGQRQIWFVEQASPGTPVHNIALAQRLRGPLDVPALRTALRAVAERQEVLRWRIRNADGAPEVAVAPPADVPLTIDDLTHLESDARPAALRQLLDEEAAAAFDLPAGPLWRPRLIRLGSSDHVLAITVHHIVFDGWSQDVLYKDLARYYRAAASGWGDGDGPVQGSFADYAARLRDTQTLRAEQEAAWWTEHLADAPHVLDLPRDRPRPPAQTFRGAACDIEISGPDADSLHELGSSLGATPFAVLLAGFSQLLRRLTGQHDFVIGTPVADRRNAAFNGLVGFFLHILPLRIQVTDEASFAEHVRRCADEIAAALAHPDAPLDRIVDTLDIARDMSRNPLIQVLFNSYNYSAPRIELPGVTGEPLQPGLPGSLFDLTLYVSEIGGSIELRAVYNPDLYDADRIGALLASYAQLLAELTARPDLPVGDASLRPAHSDLPDLSAPLPTWHGPGLVELAREVMLARPDAIAISGPQGSLQYRDVATICDQTAASVRAAGAGAGDNVAVLAEHDIRLPGILLGVLAAGSRWAVIDPAIPPEALTRRLTALQARVVIRFGRTGNGMLQGLPVVQADVLGQGSPPDEISPAAGSDPATAPADARGYLSLTSGSTGAPVLVETTERPLAHFLDWYSATFGFGPQDRFALLSGIGHDPALRDIFTPLVTGARLCIPERTWLRDPARLAAWLYDQRVTVTHLTPQLARLLTGVRGSANGIGPLTALRLVALAGDQAASTDIGALRRLAPGARIVNFYGTTETPQAHAWYEVINSPSGVNVPVGWGIEGSQLIVLGADGRPAGVGELGEVVIRSRYLASGYTDPELTRRRFQATGHGDGDDRMFRTGDFGRYLPDGAVVLAGRADDQVKVRGFRVELGEVEAILLAHPGVRAVFVTASSADDEPSPS